MGSTDTENIFEITIVEFSDPNILYKICKVNSEKYKGKIKNQDISVFGPKHNFVEYIRWFAAFLTS